MALRFLVPTVLLLLLGGCATAPEPSPWPYPDPPRPADGTTASQARDMASMGTRSELGEPQARLPAVQSLVDQARVERDTGELELAASTLERALRIDGREPLAWYELARIRFEQGNLNQADSLAHRALSYAGGQGGLTSRVWLLIADIRSLRGDEAGAAQAREQARGAGA